MELQITVREDQWAEGYWRFYVYHGVQQEATEGMFRSKDDCVRAAANAARKVILRLGHRL